MTRDKIRRRMDETERRVNGNWRRIVKFWRHVDKIGIVDYIKNVAFDA